jgi:hypothetical protein
LPGSHSGRATPSLREAPATAQDEPNRQGIHLAEPKRCLDEAGHLYRNVQDILVEAINDWFAKEGLPRFDAEG